jgi:hypothetical protein
MAAASSGGLSDNQIFSFLLAASSSAPFMMAFADGFRTRNLTFENPEKDSIVIQNQTYDLYMTTFGLNSKSYFRTADLYLLNASFEKVAKVGSEREFRVIIQSNYSRMMLPTKGLGHMSWTVPSNLPNGRYYLKYVSGWTIWRHESKFSAISDSFYILDSNCDSKCLSEIPPSPSPSSFDRESAPLELQFMFSHYDGIKVASSDFLKGIADVPMILKNPRKSLREWENVFERNPFRATGQVVGAAGLVGGISGITKAISRKASCFGGKCYSPEVFVVSDVACKGCLNGAMNALKKNGVDKFDFSPIKDSTTFLTTYSSKSPQEILELMQDIGMEISHVTGDPI